MVLEQRALPRLGEVLELGQERLEHVIQRAEHRQAPGEVVLEGADGVGVGEQSVGEDLAPVGGHDPGDVDLRRRRRRRRSGGRREDLADLDDGDVVGELLHGLDELGPERAVVVLGGKPDFSAVEVGDVDEAGGARGGAGGLEHGGSEGGAVGDLVELLGAEVVEEDVDGEDVLDGVDGWVLGEDVVHGGVVDGADGDGGPPVDLGGEVGQGQVVVEGRELRVLREDLRDVVGLSAAARGKDHRHGQDGNGGGYSRSEELHCCGLERESKRENSRERERVK
ncbi:hypothetical protein PanWU01x14_356890 [Parasponia andersonii]|uniref:Uncharacterized protein n=1 Tax=Parasponia andersonii TaxID=3476 RepID=A0A2P5A8V4_PARAD|nr:hypothetical protein PanWU01x14_356890 [Parasponia andersonii]